MGATTYRAGVPGKSPSQGMAEDSGPQGKFAMDTNDPANRGYFEGFVGRLSGFGATFENPGGMGQ